MLSATTVGTKSNPTVCFLHGFMGAATDWAAVMDDLSDRYFCVAVDLPGHGGSTEQESFRYSVTGAAAGVARVLHATGTSSCSLVGYSMGGRVALALALAAPERIRRLVLVSASPGLRTDEERARRRRTDADRARRIEADLRGFLADWYRMPLFDSLRHHGLVESMIDQRAGNDPAEIARALRGMSPGRQTSCWSDLSALSMPTLLLAGGLDDKYVGVTARMARRLPEAERAVIPGAGHNVHAERPRAYRTRVRSFLAPPAG